MKAKIKETGEIKEVSFSISTGEEILGYFDSNGIQYGVNDIEIINDSPWRYISSLSDKKIDWNQVRIQASIAAMQGIVSNYGLKYKDNHAAEAVASADELINQLKNNPVK